MRILIYTSLLLAPALANAQVLGTGRAASIGVSVQRSSHFYTTFDGFPVNEKKYSGLSSGSPFLLDTFMPTVLVLADGTSYTGVQVRLNLADNEVQYLDTKGKELVSQAPLRQLVISDTVKHVDRHLLHATAFANAPRPGWYELLAPGNINLYQLTEKTLTTSKPFNSASEEQRIDTRERLFVEAGKQLYEIKKTKDLVPLFAGKQAEMETFLRQQKNSEASLQQKATEAVKQYNKLVAVTAVPAV
jgi:hypothetical protein